MFLSPCLQSGESFITMAFGIENPLALAQLFRVSIHMWILDLFHRYRDQDGPVAEADVAPPRHNVTKVVSFPPSPLSDHIPCTVITSRYSK